MIALKKTIAAWVKKIASCYTEKNNYPSYLPVLTLVGFAIAVGLIFLSNTLYVSYPDEFINLLGAKAVLAGKVPYKDFFDHHLPFAWYFGALILLFSFKSYILFRVIWAAVIFASFVKLGLYIRQRNRELFPYYLLFTFFYPLVAVYFWLHLFLSDSLVFWLFSLLFWVLITEHLQKETNQKTLLLAIFLNFCFFFSSMTYVFVVGVIYLWILYLLLRNKKWDWHKLAKYLLIIASPYVVYVVYLFISGSLKDFYMSNFYYNTKLYIDIPNYTRGPMFNPFKFLLTIIFNFYQGYLPLLTKIKFLDLYLPIVITLGLGSFLFLFFLFFKDKLLFIIGFIILSLSAPRSNVYNLDERNYQASLFVAFALIAVCLVFYLANDAKIKDKLSEQFSRAGITLLYLLTLFSAMFLSNYSFERFYLRYTQKMPGIYDQSFTTMFLDEILVAGDTYWVGPYEPHETFFMNKTKSIGKYPSLLPQFREDDYFKNSFLDGFKKELPTVIIYKEQASIFNTPSLEFGKFFLEWVREHYVRVDALTDYKAVRSPTSFDIKSDLFIEKSKVSLIQERLIERGYLEKN